MIDEAYRLRRLYWWSFGLRFCTGVAGWLLMQFLDIPLLQDAEYYEQVGAGIAQDWLSGRSSDWLAIEGQQPHQPVLMVVIIACFYVLTLGVRALPLLMAFYSVITAFTPLLTYRICRQIGASAPAALIGGWLVAVCPAFVFWCGALYKEGLVLLVLNLAVYHALRLQTAWRARSFAVLSASLLGMVALRLYLALIMAAAIGLGLLLHRSGQPGSGAAPRLPARQPLMAMLFAVIVAGAGLAIHLQEVVPTDLGQMLHLVQSARDDLACASSGYLPEANVSTPRDAARFLPVGLTCFLAMPLPWQTGSLRQNMAIPDTAIWLLLYPLVLLGMLRGLRRDFQGSLLLIAVTLGLCLFYALMVGNVGTAYRLRVQVWLLWAPFVGLGWELLTRRSPSRRTIGYAGQQTT